MDRLPLRPTLHTRCKCGVPLNNRDKVLHCERGKKCPRSHEHDPVKWARIQEQAEGERT